MFTDIAIQNYKQLEIKYATLNKQFVSSGQIMEFNTITIFLTFIINVTYIA